MSVPSCHSNVEIPRLQGLSQEDFHRDYFLNARPVILTDATEDWPARTWTLDSLVDRVGDNEVWIRGKTNLEDYRTGKAYTIRRDSFKNYVRDLQDANARARSSYLAVANMQQAFPQLLNEIPLPIYLSKYGKLHLGPYLWVSLKGHYEFNHFDPDDNFLIILQGRKQVRLFGTDLDSLYPNPLGSHGKTVQSQVNCDSPDLKKFPKFSQANCQHCVLEEGEMLFIPAFFWHQVTALETGISVNMFYGDPGENNYITKLFRLPYRDHFFHWFLNILEQNRKHDSFVKILSRLPEVIKHFLLKQWHEVPSEEQVNVLVKLAMDHLKVSSLPDPIISSGKFPPVLKIRGLLHRSGKD